MRSEEPQPLSVTAPVFATPDLMMAHPRFGDAVDKLADGLANLYGSDRRLVRDLFEFNRAVLFMIATGIDALQDRNPDAPPMTVAMLAEAAAQMGIGPLRRVRRLVDEMREHGMLTTEPLPGDRRRQRLRSTPRMLEIDREWLAVFHAPLLEMLPQEPRYQAGVACDPIYYRQYRSVSQETLEMASRVMVENPVVDLFIREMSGARLLAVLLQAARDDAGGWTPTGFYSAAAARTATSRVHVRNVLHQARDAGLLEVSEEVDGSVRVSANLREGFARWTAHSLTAVDHVSAYAMARAAAQTIVPICSVEPQA